VDGFSASLQPPGNHNNFRQNHYCRTDSRGPVPLSCLKGMLVFCGAYYVQYKVDSYLSKPVFQWHRNALLQNYTTYLPCSCVVHIQLLNLSDPQESGILNSFVEISQLRSLSDTVNAVNFVAFVGRPKAKRLSVSGSFAPSPVDTDYGLCFRIPRAPL